MRRFPRREAEVAELARQIVAGLGENPDDFPTPPLTPERLQKLLEAYQEAHLEAVGARAAFAQAVDAKDEALQTLIRGMKTELRYAEFAVNYDNAKLKPLGWRKRKEPSPMLPPGLVRNLDVKREGSGWVSLNWKKPDEGGPVAFYQIQVRHLGRGEWQEDVRCFETAIVLKDQERGIELEYTVVAINKAGEAEPSNVVTALL